MSYVFAYSEGNLTKLKFIPSCYNEKLTEAYLAGNTIKVGGEIYWMDESEAWTVDFSKNTVVSSFKYGIVYILHVFKMVEK